MTEPKRPKSESLPGSSDEFGTPRWLFDLLNEEYLFTVDAMASALNHKLPRYYTKEDNAFARDFSGERVFCNPPYSRGMKEQTAKLAHEWTQRPDGSALWVLVLPTCTDQPWFHSLVRPPRAYHYPILGRVRFDGGATCARDSHMIVVFRNQKFLEFKRQNQKKNRG